MEWTVKSAGRRPEFGRKQILTQGRSTGRDGTALSRQLKIRTEFLMGKRVDRKVHLPDGYWQIKLGSDAGANRAQVRMPLTETLAAGQGLRNEWMLPSVPMNIIQRHDTDAQHRQKQESVQFWEIFLPSGQWIRSSRKGTEFCDHHEYRQASLLKGINFAANSEKKE